MDGKLTAIGWSSDLGTGLATVPTPCHIFGETQIPFSRVAMLTIDFEPPVIDSKPCKCCGGFTTRLTRFVHRDNDAYAVYFAQFTGTHPGGSVSVLIRIGDWADDAPPSGRCAFYLHVGVNADNFQVTVGDAAECPWGHVDLFGRTLDREEALADPRIQEIFHLADHVFAEDVPLIEYLCPAPGDVR